MPKMPQYDSCAQPLFEDISREPRRDSKILQIKEHAEALQGLFASIGIKGQCRGCRAQIYWVRDEDRDKTIPFNIDGTNHFTTCPKAGQVEP